MHKKTVMATIRTPDRRGARGQATREFATFTGRLVELRDWLVSEGVTQVAMEATEVKWFETRIAHLITAGQSKCGEPKGSPPA